MTVAAAIREELALLGYAFASTDRAPLRSNEATYFPYVESALETRIIAIVFAVSVPPDILIAHLFLPTHPLAMWTLDGLGFYVAIRAFGQLKAYRRLPHCRNGERWTLRRGSREREIDARDVAAARSVARDEVRSAKRGAHADLAVGREHVVEITLAGPGSRRILATADEPARFCAAVAELRRPQTEAAVP